MKDFLVQLDDLPDEILMYIFKKLHNVHVLHSFIGVNQRLNRIVRDTIFTSNLPLLQDFPDNSISSLPDSMLDRFCSKILPEIGHQVETLYLEPTSMERILLATNYPNLSVLFLYGIHFKTARSLFNSENRLVNTFKNQISSLFINIIYDVYETSMDDVCIFIFTQILTLVTNLRCLDFNTYLSPGVPLTFDMSPLTASSSTLLELHVTLVDFSDCLDLLDGRFDQLSVLCVNIQIIDDSPYPLTINDNKKLPNLKIFSLYCNGLMFGYQEAILPLLQRMVNLKQLDLTMKEALMYKCIDGDVFMKDIIIHMPKLNKFTFNIYTTIYNSYLSDLPLNEHIQQTFKYFYDQIISCIDRFEEKGRTQHHIYSYPYKLVFYNNITNNFPGGLFNGVTKVTLYDERPFEYEFFLRIGRSFPFMKQLNISNEKPQNDKQFIKSEDHNQILSIIEYPNLTELYFNQAHDDYVELFLLHTKVSLPNNVHLFVDYKSMERVTDNFTRNTTRINCAKFVSLHRFWKGQVDERVRDYFPHTCIYTE